MPSIGVAMLFLSGTNKIHIFRVIISEFIEKFFEIKFVEIYSLENIFHENFFASQKTWLSFI